MHLIYSHGNIVIVFCIFCLRILHFLSINRTLNGTDNGFWNEIEVELGPSRVHSRWYTSILTIVNNALFVYSSSVAFRSEGFTLCIQHHLKYSKTISRHLNCLQSYSHLLNDSKSILRQLNRFKSILIFLIWFNLIWVDYDAFRSI